ncbi:MAG: DMT family transporter [Peptococcaceae bacterium]|nr:DMT family transporter [Peptococcaceae bacterium]
MKHLRPHLKGMLFLTGAFALAGTSVISARFVAEKLGTFTITAVSLFFALLILVPPAAGRIIESIRGASARDWAYLFLQALFGIFLFRMFLLLGLLHTTSAEAGILTGATPAITAVLSRLLLKETMGASKITGILSTVTGILFIQGLLVPGKCFLPDHIFGNILVLCAAACESLFNVCSRVAVVKARPAEKAAMPPMVKTVIVSFIAMFLCLIPACFEQPAGSLAKLGLQGWISLVWYGVFVTALAFLFWYSGIKRCPASTAAAFSGMMPFTALLLSVLILGEHAAVQQWFGGILVISGMVLIGRGGNKSISQEAV